MKDNKIKIDAVVVLYNPDNTVIKNINSYAHHVRKVYVIDNSDCGEQNVIKQIQSISNSEYISMDGNKGIAKALNVALEAALKDGTEYLLTMDQDSSFEIVELKKFFDYIRNNQDKRIGIFAASTNKKLKKSVYKNKVITSGNIIMCSKIKEIGGWDENLFIDWVDHDICLRLISKGYKILMFANVYIKHKLGEDGKCNLGRIDITFNTHSAIRYYYMTRNKFYVLSKHKLGIANWIRYIAGSIFMLFKVLLLENDKSKRMKYIYRGYVDFFRGRMGKYIDL